MTTPDTVGERLARIETKLDQFLAQQTKHELTVQANHTDHETRIRRLERALWIATGAGLVAGGGAGAIVAQMMGA